MNRHRQVQQSAGRFRFTLSLVYAAVVFSCAGQDVGLIGSWVSTEITHPSPFFSETLDQDKHGNVLLLFDRTGEFMWMDSQGVCHAGKYLCRDRVLVLTSSRGEPIPLVYAFRENQLELKTPDGFIFEFQKVLEGDHAVAKPCNRFGRG